jgi:hypothetical protein
MNMASVTTNTTPSEQKIYYEIGPNGMGRVRQHTTNPESGLYITIEADFRWKYLGANRWLIMLPPSTAYRVLDANQFSMGYRPAVTFTVRYYDDNLYEEGIPLVLVPADPAHVAALSQRLRSQPQLIHIETQ